MSSSWNNIFLPLQNLSVYGENIMDNKVVEKSLCNMLMKVDHVVTTIMELHDIDTLQGSIESHVNRILQKTEKAKEEALKSQVNFNNINESNQMGEDMETSIKRENNFNPKGGNNFGSINYIWQRKKLLQPREEKLCFHREKFERKADD